MSAANTKVMVNNIKAEGEDFEWYPTTREMVEKIYDVFRKNAIGYNKMLRTFESVLDIGAGDGRVLNYFNEIHKHRECVANSENKHFYCPDITKYAIEKSSKLQESWEKNIIPLGCDFNESTLIDKEVDLIFCNPPYSQFKQWTLRILKEAVPNYIAMIIPTRWSEDSEIQTLVKTLDYNVIKVDSSDFLNADRQARAKVDLLLFERQSKIDSLERFLDSEFGFDKFNSKKSIYEDCCEEQKKLADEMSLVSSENFIDYLVNRYNAEFDELVESIKSIKNLSPKIAKALKLDKVKITEAIKSQISSLKFTYWKELFNKLDSLTSRLTTKHQNLNAQLIANRGLDFTKNNIYSVIIWVIKKANEYIENAYVEVWDELVWRANPVAYKSNKHFTQDDWRYAKSDFLKVTPHKLDYRVVIESITQAHSYIHRNYGHELARDIAVIANNLGFQTRSCDADRVKFEAQKNETMYYLNFVEKLDVLGNKDTFAELETLFETKNYLNGNAHIKFNKEFLAKWAIVVGKKRGWLRDKSEASEEFKDMLSPKQVSEIWDKPLGLDYKNAKHLLGFTG